MRSCLAVGLFCLVAFEVPRAEAHSRRTPIVEAVQKTRASVVVVQSERADGSKGATGTGVFVDERGYLITSRHVVAGAARVRVHLVDGTVLPTEVIADEIRTDLAILRVRSEKPVLALRLAPSDDLLVGETVIAIGHPLGFKHSVSTGIISALGRSIPMPGGEKLNDVIQINASINPGNSGGALLNINGELIGINAAIRDGAQGIAFAVSSATVQDMLNRHLSSLKVANVRHGLTCAEKLVEEAPVRQRLVVASVGPGTPAAHAGLKQGDVILCIADRTIANRFDLERSMWDCKPGVHLKFKIVRQDRELDVAVTLKPAIAVTQTTSR